MKRDAAVTSFRLLIPLAVAVLLLHLVLLQSMVLTVGLVPVLPGRVFSTRSIEFSGVTQAAPPSAVKAVSAVRAARKSVRSDPIRADSPPPAVAAVETVEPVAVSPPALQDEKSSSRPEETATQEPAPADAEPLAAAPRPLREQAASAGDYAVPASVVIKYQVSSNKFPFNLNAELAWQQHGESYDARLAFGAFGLSRVQTSRGQITAEGLAPLRFSDKYRSEVAAHFVRDKGKVTFSANTPDVPLLAGAQDRLSIVVQLAAMIAGDPGRFPAATTIALQTVGPRDADIWLFTVEDEEILSLPGGQQPTRKLVRNPRREYDQKVELWLAPALGYLPARIRITEFNGDFIDQKWSASEPQG